MQKEAHNLAWSNNEKKQRTPSSQQHLIRKMWRLPEIGHLSVVAWESKESAFVADRRLILKEIL